MSNIDVNERADKRNALDAFASAPSREVSPAPSILPMASPGDRVFGAQQVAVYRDETRILQKLAALGAAAGDDWFYRFPVRKKVKDEETGQDKWVKDWIEGASIKLANDLSRIYGNCEIDTRVIDLGSSWLIYARFTDFETGYALTRPFQQDKGGSKMGGRGGDADARRLDIAFQIGVSKAIRNVVVNALQTFADHAFDAARNSLVDKIGRDILKWRNEILVRLKDRGIDHQRVEMVLGRASADWTAPDVAKIIAMMKAVADGMATIDETFPPRGGHDPETGEINESTTSTASQEPGAHSERDAGTAGQAGTPSGPDTTAGPADKSSSAQSSAKPVTQAETTASGPAASDSIPPKDTEAANGAGKIDASNMTAPKNEAEYIAWANAWREDLTDAKEGEDRWKAEKTMRNKANVGPDARESLQEALTKKVAEIRDADRS